MHMIARALSSARIHVSVSALLHACEGPDERQQTAGSFEYVHSCAVRVRGCGRRGARLCGGAAFELDHIVRIEVAKPA
eukprot:5045444-Pleurochrysis_carterae.AAC.1